MGNKNYTNKQLEVINIKSGYHMVLAGPGCGKTDILAERVAVAVESNIASFDDMLCLTFTNRAARGMYNRIHDRIGSDTGDLFVGNIHRYCSHFLFDNSVVPAEASVMDEDDTKEVLESEVSEDDIKNLIGYSVTNSTYGQLVSLDWTIVNDLLGIDIHPSGETERVQVATAQKIVSKVRYKVMDMQHLIFQVKRGHPQKDWYHREITESSSFKYYYPFIDEFIEACNEANYDAKTYFSKTPVEKLLALAVKFEEYKDNNGLLDFDDLLIKTYEAYYNDVEHNYKRYKWIQVDEIQDLSNFQLSLVDLITDQSRDFVVVYLGDEQQAIYSFMGASLDSLNILKSRCLNHIHRLDKNFRSPKYLLDLYNEYATKVLNVDSDFLPEPQDNVQANFLDVCIHDYDSLRKEVDRVYDAVLPFLRTEEHRDERTALLVPWNIDANEISDRLKNANIQHFKISGLDSFQTVHLKTLFAHFNAVDNDFNLIAWSRMFKQSDAVETYSKARHLIEEMRNVGMCPSDLLRDNGSTLGEFAYYFDNEEIVLFDTETTGVDVFKDDIIQIAAIKIRNGIEVPGSFKEIYLRTDKEKIPLKLGTKDNPMVKDYAEAEKDGRVVTRNQGLSDFMQYVGDAVLLGHNVNYDYNILKYNLKRYCGSMYDYFETPILDTLKLAHLICPRLKKYKLEYLIDKLNLKGTNSHNAKDDIMATFELAKYCRKQTDDLLTKQVDFYQKPEVQEVIYNLSVGYKECYDLTKSRLYRLRDDNDAFALIDEMKELSQSLSRLCEFNLVDRFDLILSFLNEDVISRTTSNALKAQFNEHLMDMSTYREADMCESSNFKEKLFVSTVHKAKGLEFENVIVMHAVNDRYPHFAHSSIDQQEEDKRLFYVAISRAKKRLIVSGSSIEKGFTPFINSIAHRFTLRFAAGRFLIEIGNEMLRVIENGIIIRQYHNLERIYYSQTIQNQFDLQKRLRWMGVSSNTLDKVDALMHSFGLQHTIL